MYVLFMQIKLVKTENYTFLIFIITKCEKKNIIGSTLESIVFVGYFRTSLLNLRILTLRVV